MNETYCCSGPVFYSCVCGVCIRVCHTAHQQHTRIGYLLITILSFSFGLCFLYKGDSVMGYWENYGYDCHREKEKVCLGIYTIYRESFSLTIFYLLMAFASYAPGRYTSIANRSCWVIKIFIISTIFITTLFIPNTFFVVFREFSRYASTAFLVIQVCVILDISYAWNDSWIESYENSNGTNYKHLLLFFFSGIFWVMALVTTVLNFYWFSKDTGCEMEVFLISFTLALGVTYTFLSLTNFVEYGSLLTSSILNLYCVYLCWSGMMNDSDSHCNTWDTASDTIIGIFAGIGMLGVNLAYTCFWKRESVADQSFIRAIAGALLVKEIPDEEIYNDQDSGRNLFFFHLYMALVSTYMSMILTNWGSANITNNPKKTYENDSGTLWIKFVAMWISVIMYVASMLIPKFRISGWTKVKDGREMV